jgi:hypothetical protein
MPRKAGKDISEAAEAEADKETGGRSISLAPLTFEEAVAGLLQVKLEPEELRPPKGKRPPRGAKKD